MSEPRRADARPDRQDRLFTRILLAIAAGILAGVLFGEATRLLTIASVGFVRLLQVNVLPYLLGSLIAGLGARNADELTPLARNGLCLLLVVWGLALLLVAACGLALPDFGGEPVFGDTASVTQIDWLELYIPSNLFHALANNLVPAVVLFGVLAGVALGQVRPERKAMLLQALDAFNGGRALVVTIPPVEGAATFVADLLPNAVVRGYTRIEPALADPQVTALLIPLERAYYWSRIHPELTAIRPEGVTTSTAVVYAMPRGEIELRELVNHWLEIRSAAGEADEARAYWIRGTALRTRQRRWSVLDAVRSWLAD